MSKLEQILQALPQTQCELCQHPGCKPYAEAIIAGKDSIDKCHPGGEQSLRAIGKILNTDVAPYLESVRARTTKASTIIIDPVKCIGCTKCIQACPVDAIVGTAKANHVVIESECTGCNLCLPVCPVDCMHEQPVAQYLAHQLVANYRRQRFEKRNQRLEQAKQASKAKHKSNKSLISERLQQLKAKDGHG